MKKFITTILMVNIIIYLSCSISELSFNLVNWEEEIRKAYAVFFCFINILSLNIYITKKDETEKQIR